MRGEYKDASKSYLETAFKSKYGYNYWNLLSEKSKQLMLIPIEVIG